MNALKLEVVKGLRLEVEGKEYLIEFPLSAIQIAEEKLGHSLRAAGQWMNIPAAEIPALLEAGLLKHHPEVTEADVKRICDCLTPEALDEVLYALCHIAFPKYMELLDKITAERLQAKAEGRKLPNVPGGAAH